MPLLAALPRWPTTCAKPQQAAEPAAASTPDTETEEEETLSPDSGGHRKWRPRRSYLHLPCLRAQHQPQKLRCSTTAAADVILAPHTATLSRSAGALPAEEEAAEGAMFAADDLPATRTASTMLRDVRGIRTAQQAQQAQQARQAQQAQQAGAAEPPGAASAVDVGREVSEELPVSTSPPDAESMTVAGPDVLAPPAAGRQAEQPTEEPAATPAYRFAALQRLAHIFGGFRGWAAEGAGRQDGSGAAAAEEEEQDEEAGALPPEAALPLSPVQKYINYRRGKRLARKQAQQAAAAAEGREPPPPTPLPASYSGLGEESVLGLFLLLARAAPACMRQHAP